MNRAIAAALAALVLLFGQPASARGWDWFLIHIRPSGGCGSAHEIIGSYYTHGARTATGERFNPHGISAAHRTLPFGTVVHVHVPKTGRSLDVRVNDRGPYIRGVHPEGAIDLSLGAARALGMTASQYICVSW